MYQLQTGVQHLHAPGSMVSKIVLLHQMRQRQALATLQETNSTFRTLLTGTMQGYALIGVDAFQEHLTRGGFACTRARARNIYRFLVRLVKRLERSANRA